MKILLISNMYPSTDDPTYGTFVKVFKESIEENAPDIHFDMCVIKGRTNNVFLKLCKYFTFYFFIFYKVLFKRYDVVYNHQITHSSPALYICLLLKKIKLVMNIHGGDVVTTKKISRHLLKIAKIVLRKSSAIVVPSNYFKKIVINRIENIDADKIYISPSGGVSGKVFYNKQTKRGNNSFVYVSRIDKGKGWDTLVDALKKLDDRKQINDFTCYFYGYGKQVNELNRLIEVSNLSDKCKYIGARTHNELCEIYNNTKFMVFPTQLQESLGLVGIEAMMCGCPVIGSNIGCLPEYIKDNINGFLFNPFDSDNLANIISLCLSMDEKKYNEMSQAAHNTSTLFETTGVAHDMISIIRNIKSNG